MPAVPRLGLIARYVYSQFEASWTHQSFLSTLVPVSSKCPSAEPIILSLILATVSLRLSAHLFTMLLIVPVAIGMLNTPERISWVRLMLTAPTVFNATANAWRFSPYCTAAFTSEGKAPLRVSPYSIQIGSSSAWCSVTLTVTTASITWRFSAIHAVPLHIW